MTHSYTNPSKKQDLAHLEAQVTKGKKYYDEQGWEISAPISDRECIYPVSYTHLTLPTSDLV